MKVILTVDVKGIGKKGQIVDVADGYGRNFLLKKKQAVLATDGGIREAAVHQEKANEKQAALLGEAKALAALLEGKEFILHEKVGTEKRLFGAVTTQEICDLVNRQLGLSLDKKKFELKDPIKHLGVYDCRIKVYAGVNASIKIQVKEAE